MNEELSEQLRGVALDAAAEIDRLRELVMSDDAFLARLMRRAIVEDNRTLIDGEGWLALDVRIHLDVNEQVLVRRVWWAMRRAEDTEPATTDAPPAEASGAL